MNTQNILPEFRNAKHTDSDKASQLIYESSKDMFDYTYQIDYHEPIDFIRYCFESGKGFLGYNSQTVGLIDNQIVFTATSHAGKDFLKLTWQTIRLSFTYYGWKSALKILVRSSKIAHLFIQPKKDSLFLANICTDQSVCGTGVFKSYFRELIDTITSPSVNQIELNVSYANTNALAVYEKVGFEVMTSCDYKGDNYNITGSYRMLITV